MRRQRRVTVLTFTIEYISSFQVLLGFEDNDIIKDVTPQKAIESEELV